MKRLLHPSLPVIVGVAAVVIAGLLLLASVVFADWLAVDSVGGAPATEAVAGGAIVAELAPETPPATLAAAGSHVLGVRDRLVEEGEDFIEADLTGMNLKVYREGKVVLDVPIRTKGKEGSWWETPVGVYGVVNKEENHFSSFGHVNQPWSLVFQGNFFIHGWPTYPDGSPVSSRYSGGCIRLADEDAERVFEEAEIGMPVLVYKHPREAPPLPAFSGDPELDGGFLVADVTTGAAIRARDASAEVPFGPAVHLLTALTAVDYINVENGVNVGPAEGSDRLRPVERASVLDLLRLLLSEGDPEAARTIASARTEKAFVRYMNAKAAAVGMTGTRVASVEPNDPGNRTTLADLALLARYLAENRSFVLQLTREARGNLAYDPPLWDDLRHDPDLLALPGFVGGFSAPAGSGLPGVAVVKVGTGDDEREVAFAASGEDPTAALAAIAAWLRIP